MVAGYENDVTPFEQFLEGCSEEYRKTQRGLKEIDLLIQQTTSEVERLAYRNTQSNNRLRHVEAAIDTVPRQDMQEAYTTVLDTQQRLFTMRGQLEKLQSDQRNMARYLDLLRAVLEHSDRPESYEREGAEEEEQSTQSSVVRIIEAQERERRRLSRQMHDGPAQSLTNLILQAEICERLLDANPEQARVELRNLKNSVAGTFQKVKEFILNLRPMMLDDLGLVPTLRRYLENFSENSDVQTDLEVVGKERRLASHHEVTTFRIVQELLNSAKEQSHASSARITLDMEGDHLGVVFEDDGDGLEITDALASQEAEELGLVTMRERVEMLGGEIHFDSDLGRGTRVSFRLPIS
jgi:two-component system sensor histidine kinase DegS